MIPSAHSEILIPPWQTHRPRAIMNPLKEPFTHMKVITHSKQPHRYSGIFLDGDARIIRSAQIMGRHMRLMKAWSRMSLRTPLPLVLFATWRCHNKLIFNGRPTMMLAMHTIERDTWWSLNSSIMACSHSEEQLAVEELLLSNMDNIGKTLIFPYAVAIHNRTLWFQGPISMRCITSSLSELGSQNEWEHWMRKPDHPPHLCGMLSQPLGWRNPFMCQVVRTRTIWISDSKNVVLSLLDILTLRGSPQSLGWIQRRCVRRSSLPSLSPHLSRVPALSFLLPFELHIGRSWIWFMPSLYFSLLTRSKKVLCFLGIDWLSMPRLHLASAVWKQTCGNYFSIIVKYLIILII